jgi:glutamate formiminotransferase
MFDTNNTPIFRVLNLVENEARRYGVSVVGTQIVGCLPQEALVNCAEHYLRLENFNRDQIIEKHLVGL